LQMAFSTSCVTVIHPNGWNQYWDRVKHQIFSACSRSVGHKKTRVRIVQVVM
jgi:hypothetical protein